MKNSHFLVAFLALLIVVPSVPAQNSANSQGEMEIKNKKGRDVAVVSETPQESPLKILVVISEFDSTKKISSLPYTLYTITRGVGGQNASPRESMRYGVRVPIATGAFSRPMTKEESDRLVSTQFTYQNVGTDIDYGAYRLSDGYYQLVFTVDRSWATMPGAENKTAQGQLSVVPGQPMIPDFRDNFVVVLKDGQSVEGASAVDPVSGHVLKVNVTLTALK